MATVLLRDQTDIKPVPDGKELVDLRWFTFADAEEAFRKTNHPEKSELLLKSMGDCRRDLLGGMSPQDRAAILRRGA